MFKGGVMAFVTVKHQQETGSPNVSQTPDLEGLANVTKILKYCKVLYLLRGAELGYMLLF